MGGFTCTVILQADIPQMTGPSLQHAGLALFFLVQTVETGGFMKLLANLS